MVTIKGRGRGQSEEYCWGETGQRSIKQERRYSGKLGKMEERRETSWCELEEGLGAGEMKRNGGD